MYRISTTSLEKFRRFINNVSPYDTEESLLEVLKGTFTGTAKTRFGRAYHKVIEGEYKEDKVSGTFRADDLIFTAEQALPALHYRYEHPCMTHEMDARKIYHTNYFDIQVSARVDAVEGLHVRDVKTKFRTPDWTEYIDSCQWKFYLDILNADIFWYDVFEVKKFPDEEANIYPGVVIQPYQSVMCMRYKGMQGDIQTLLNDFLDYVANRKLFGYLKPAIEDEPLFF